MTNKPFYGQNLFNPVHSEARPEAVIGPLKTVPSILMTRLNYFETELGELSGDSLSTYPREL